jgi:tRNA(Ile)-lysidine synthase
VTGAERTPLRPAPTDPTVAALLARCALPPAGAPVVCALSGGADSSALLALAVAAGCRASAIHVHHGLHPAAEEHAAIARRTASTLGAPFECRRVHLPAGPNLEARARSARRAALGAAAVTGHTADDQAETVLLALLRGSGSTGLAAMSPGPARPILALRRHETRALCDHLGLEVAEDPTNRDPRFRRNRIRHELLPLLDGIAARDVTPLLNRAADLLRADDELLERLADDVDPTDAAALVAAPAPLAARAVRRWLAVDGYPPDAATVARVMDVADGRCRACDVGASRRVERHQGRLRLFPHQALPR